MNRPLQQPSLTEFQRAQISAAVATLRFGARNAFLLDLASALARCPQPLSDRALKTTIGQLLGLTPIRSFIQQGDDQCN
jgi:hypothetical protein